VTKKNAAVAVIVGGLLLVVGSFLPWFTYAGESVNGFDGGDAWFTLFAGLILAVLGYMTYAGRSYPSWIGWVVAALAGVLVVIDYFDIKDTADLFGGSVGMGVWIMFAGVIVALVGLFMGRKEA